MSSNLTNNNSATSVIITKEAASIIREKLKSLFFDVVVDWNEFIVTAFNARPDYLSGLSVDNLDNLENKWLQRDPRKFNRYTELGRALNSESCLDITILLEQLLKKASGCSYFTGISSFQKLQFATINYAIKYELVLIKTKTEKEIAKIEQAYSILNNLIRIRKKKMVFYLLKTFRLLSKASNARMRVLELVMMEQMKCTDISLNAILTCKNYVKNCKISGQKRSRDDTLLDVLFTK